MILTTGLLLLLTGIAALTDLRNQKIYNWNTYPGILLALAFNFREGGSTALEDALWGFAGCGGVMLVCFVLFPDLGGGDVKLMAMLGAGLGLFDAILAMLWTFAIAFAAALCLLIWQEGVARLALRLAALIREAVVMRGRITPVPDGDYPLRRRLHLAPSAFLAVLIVRWHELVKLVA